MGMTSCQEMIDTHQQLVRSPPNQQPDNIHTATQTGIGLTNQARNFT